MAGKQSMGVTGRNLGFLISDVHRLLTTAVDREVSALGLTRSQLRVILHLIRGDSLSQVKLAEDLQLGKVTVGGLLDRLEEKGLIERRTHPSDRRAKLVYLSLKDQAMYDSIVDSGRVILEQIVEGINDKEQAVLIELLLRIEANTKKVINS